MNTYQTTNLVDATILAARGEPFRIRESAETDILTFTFDSTPEAKAQETLASAEASVCRGFHRALVRLRKVMNGLRAEPRR